MKQVMWMERRFENASREEQARIGWVQVKKRRREIVYGNQVFTSLPKQEDGANYVDRSSGVRYWIAGCRRDGCNAAHIVDVEVDEDALEEYWICIRLEPERVCIKRFQAPGHPELYS